MIEEKNATIQKADITMEEHGFLTFWIQLDYGGAGQAAGGYVLANPFKKSGCSTMILAEILQVVGAESWAKLAGKNIRVKADNNKVYALGHIIKDHWLDLGEWFKNEDNRR